MSNLIWEEIKQLALYEQIASRVIDNFYAFRYMSTTRPRGYYLLFEMKEGKFIGEDIDDVRRFIAKLPPKVEGV